MIEKKLKSKCRSVCAVLVVFVPGNRIYIKVLSFYILPVNRCIEKHMALECVCVYVQNAR